MMTQTDQRAQCPECTVPVDQPGLCRFCRTYSGSPVDSATRLCCGGIGGHALACTPAKRFDDMTRRIDGIRAEINNEIGAWPDDTPMFAIVDVVNALWNLRNASVLLDKASDTLEADAEAVK